MKSCGTKYPDDGDEGGESTCTNLRSRRVEEYLDQGNTSRRQGCLLEVADTKTDSDKKNEASDGTDVDREDNCLQKVNTLLINVAVDYLGRFP